MRKKSFVQQILLCIFFGILCALIVFPFWLLISASLSNASELVKNGYQIWPNPVDFSAYKVVFKNPQQILRAYGVTIVFSTVTMVLSEVDQVIALPSEAVAVSVFVFLVVPSSSACK